MIRFNLTLSDYLDQYVADRKHDLVNCPVCYENVLVDNRSKDVRHILDCYKQQTILNVMREYHDKFDEYPELTDDFMDLVWTKVELEMLDYYQKHSTQPDHSEYLF